MSCRADGWMRVIPLNPLNRYMRNTYYQGIRCTCNISSTRIWPVMRGDAGGMEMKRNVRQGQAQVEVTWSQAFEVPSNS